MNINLLPEYKNLCSDFKKSRNQTRKLSAKIKKIERELYFLDRLQLPRKNTDTQKNDFELEVATKHLFEYLNFKSIKPISNADVDVKVKFQSFYFGIEVKNGKSISENDTIQPFKHRLLNEDNYHPILLFNNSVHNNNWDIPRIKLAEKMGFGILLTIELVKGFTKLKQNKISFNHFLNHLNQVGEIKFNTKSLDKTKKSVIL